jgi:amino acid transporter
MVPKNYSNVLNLVLLAIGVKESIRLHTIMTVINLMVVLFVVIVGAFKINFHNWNLSESEVGSGNGKGGFLPFGFSGMMSGKNCYYIY